MANTTRSSFYLFATPRTSKKVNFQDTVQETDRILKLNPGRGRANAKQNRTTGIQEQTGQSLGYSRNSGANRIHRNKTGRMLSKMKPEKGRATLCVKSEESSNVPYLP
ncbi:hypothetical protein XELAEV_18001715mg [Xenopus laevis]|nr:hypothetical protein XELAEV_18001715mg [Xenopus laevis]